jgi:hypothetical protein
MYANFRISYTSRTQHRIYFTTSANLCGLGCAFSRRFAVSDYESVYIAIPAER